MIEYAYNFKICVFADKDVRIKTLPGFLEGGFDIDYGSTMGFDLFSKYIEIKGKKVKLSLWIWSDKEVARVQYHSFIEGSHWLILMYDITNSRSLNFLSEFLKTVKKFREKNPPILLVGNKLDLEEYREISKEQLEKFKEENDISESIELSLETGDNVENMFRKLTEMMFQTKIEENDFRLELIREPIRESGEEYINPFREVKELKKELTELTNSINIWGPKIHMGKTFWIIYLIILISTIVITISLFFK